MGLGESGISCLAAACGTAVFGLLIAWKLLTLVGRSNRLSFRVGLTLAFGILVCAGSFLGFLCRSGAVGTPMGVAGATGCLVAMAGLIGMCEWTKVKAAWRDAFASKL